VAGPLERAWAKEPPDLAELQRRYDRLQRRMDEMQASMVSKKLCQVQREEVVQLIKEMNADAATRSALPSWMENFKIYGDLRLRYQLDCQQEDGNGNVDPNENDKDTIVQADIIWKF